MPDVLEEIDAARGRGEIGGIGHRRELVAEVGARNHRACGDGRIEIEAAGNAHEADAQGAGYGPGTAHADRYDGANQRACGVENTRIENLHAEVDHARHRAAQYPGADQHAHGEQNQGRAQTDANTVDDPFLDAVPGSARALPEQCRQRRGQHQGDLIGAVGRIGAEQVHGNGQKGDEKNNGGGSQRGCERVFRLWGCAQNGHSRAVSCRACRKSRYGYRGLRSAPIAGAAFQRPR